MDWLTELLANKYVAAAITGALVAARQDRESWKKSFDNWGDLTDFNWKLASFRWCKGAVVGLGTALGISGLDWLL